METEDEMATDSEEDSSIYHVPIKTDPSPPATQSQAQNQAQMHDPLTTSTSIALHSPSHLTAGVSAPPKKGKSRSQEVLEPKALLPPGRRAKTEEEKEQRRVERLLRNRKAAEASRGRKRAEMEGLEKKVVEQARVIDELRRRNRELEGQLAEERARFLQVEE